MKTLKATVSVEGSGDLRDRRGRVIAIEAAAQGLCEFVGEGPDDGVAMLLIAAAHIYAVHADKPLRNTIEEMQALIVKAIAVAEKFFDEPRDSGRRH